MNVPSIALWGLVATVLLTTILALCQGVGLTRMSLPFILGTIVTPDRDRAMAWGTVLHVMNGWLISLAYALIFESLGMGTWWLGATIGLLQALFVLAVVMPLVPAFHPRMVSEYVGPAPNRRLQPPGFMARNYGRPTAMVTTLAHIVFGGIIGAGYHLLS